jgi:hypothetical protein
MRGRLGHVPCSLAASGSSGSILLLCLAASVAAEEASPTTAPPPSVQAEEAPVLTVEAGAGDPLYAPPAYQEGQTFLRGAPLQKQITIAEAMDLPGAFGDPVASVRNIPGVVTGPGGELFLLGSKDRESSLTINHLPVGYLFHIDGLHSVLASEAIDQIDVTLGAFDTTYGNAIGGVIDLTPRYPTAERKGYFKLGVLDGGAGYEGGNGNWAAAVHLRRSWFDLILDPSSFNDSESKDTITTVPKYQDASLFLVYRRGEHRLSFENIYARDEIGANLQDNAVKDPQLTGNLDVKQQFVTNGLRWAYDRGAFTSETLVSRLGGSNRLNLSSDLRYDAPYQVYSVYHATTIRNERHAVTAGVEASLERNPFDARFKTVRDPDTVDQDFTSSPTYDVDQTIKLPTYGIFVQDLFTMRADWKLRYGVRAERTDYGAFETQVMPRGALVHELTPHDSLSLASGLYSLRPEAYKLLADAGNPRLKDQRSVQHAVSWNHRFAEIGEFTVEPFLKKYRDLVVDSRASNYSNDGTGRTVGFNVSAKLGGDDWYVLAGYGFQQGRRRLSAEDPEQYSFYGDVPHTFQIAGSHRFNQRWSASFLSKYSTGQAYTPIEGTYLFTDGNNATRLRPIYGRPYSKRFDDFFTFNIKVGYDRNLGSGYRLESAFEVLNLTNHLNVTGIEYDDNYNKKRDVVNLGTLPTLSFTLRY